MSRFDVAIWRQWPSYGLPIVGQVWAVDGPAAIEAVMWAFGIPWAAHVAAHDREQGVTYRADQVSASEEQPLLRRRASDEQGRRKEDGD